MPSKWKGRPIDYSRMIAMLARFQRECRSQKLGLECEMATVLMSIVEHDRGDFAEFSSRRFRPHLRKLQHALEHDESSTVQPGDEHG